MAGWSNAWEVNVLDWFFNGASPTVPGTLHLGLFKTEPADGDTGATLWNKEVQVGDWDTYGRIAITRAGSNWNTGTPGDPSSFQNANLLQYNEAGAGANVQVSWWALLDDGTLGNGALVFHGVLATPLTVTQNVQPQFNVGALFVRLGG